MRRISIHPNAYYNYKKNRKDGTFRYNCTIIDLFDRSVIASENSRKIRQSMSRTGYPYDNAPMERYFNTLKTELLNVRSPLCSIIIGCRC
ncbi:MAG: hypothetical protein SPH83_01925 [Treponema sp.]|nr:hypothetical protein [Spirochaetales bacterium]MDY4523567.1 hypothetical protein [Treponema sp.]MDY6189238.1 hypothetical protein [Treponema sp.]